MDTEERVKQTIRMLRGGGTPHGVNSYLQELKMEDPLAFSLVEIYMCAIRHQFSLAIRKGIRLLRQPGDDPWTAWHLSLSIGLAYRGIGAMESAESYLMTALEKAEMLGNKETLSVTRLEICITRFWKGEYEQACQELLSFRKEPGGRDLPAVDYYLGLYALIVGQPSKAIRHFDSLLGLLEVDERSSLRFGPIEMKALALRILGKFSEAREGFVESATGYIGYGSAYSAFTVAKALELARLTGLEPPPRNLIKKALSLAKRGSWGEQAAAQEIAALLKEDDSEAAEGLYEASKNYLRAYQNIEALLSGLTAAYLAWKTDSQVFTKALKLIAPLIPLHPGFKKDPILGDFMAEMEPFLTKTLRSGQDKEGIRAYLIGGLRVIVDGKEISMMGWRNNKAIKGLVYLLLSQKHRIPSDHLFYLLWPRRAFNEKTRSCLYTAMATIRRNLGRSGLLTKKRDFYQLEDTWTDLGEIENLLRLADATHDPVEKEELLSRARELARGELLPEFPYDRHIEEYRYHYERLRKRLRLE